MTIVIMVCVWHAIVPAIYFQWGSNVADTSDVAVAAALGSAYVLAHIVFAIVIASRVRPCEIHQCLSVCLSIISYAAEVNPYQLLLDSDAGDRNMQSLVLSLLNFIYRAVS